MAFRIETDAHLRATLGEDGPAWASSYLRLRKHCDGDMEMLELAAWFDAAVGTGREIERNSVLTAFPAPDGGA